MLNNHSLLQKADLALADLTLGGGVLRPAQAQKFMRMLIKQSVLLPLVTVVPMQAPKQQVQKLKFGSRILRPAQEAVALTKEQRSAPNFSYIELDAKMYKAEVRLSDEVLEDSIERGELRQTIVEMMADSISRDIEELVISGDTASTDPFLATMDGILKQASSHVVDAAGARLTKNLLHDVIKALPNEYLRDKAAMRFFTSVDSDLDYRNTLTERATQLGDKFLETDGPVLYSGIPLQPIPLFPDRLGAANNQTQVLLANPKNVQLGIWRQIRFESAREISDGVLKIVATLRFDVRFAEELAVAKAVNVLAA